MLGNQSMAWHNERNIAMPKPLNLKHPVHLEAILNDIWNKWLEGLISRRERNMLIIKATAEDELREYHQEFGQ